MNRSRKSESRRITAWEGKNDLTQTQSFIKDKIEEHYAQRHPKLSDSGEAELINSFMPPKCPFCDSDKFRKYGLTANGVQRYRCTCGKTFLPTTGTIFDEHRISISEWIEYCMNLFRHVSISVDSWNNRNAFSTSRYWLQKVFLTLQGSQDGIVLSGDVWLDETYYSVISRDAVRHEDGKKLRGLSRNQLCIGVATDKRHTLFLVEGNGKPSQKKTFETFHSHIAPGSTLIHDKEQAHAKLIKVLALQSTVYASEELKGLPDRENPLEPVNRQHALMKHFLNAHAGFLRENLQGYLDLFSYVTNPPYDLAEKVDSLINLVFHNPKSLRYRDFYQAKSSDSEPWMQHYAIDDLNYFYPINKAVDHYKQVAERLLKTDSVSAYDKIAIKYHLSQYKYLNDDIEAMSYNTYELKKVLDYAQTAEHNDQFIFKEGVKKLYYLSHIDNAVQIFTISIPKGYRKDCKYPLFLIFSTFRNSFDAGLYSNYLDRPIIAADITGRGFTLGSYIGEAVIWDLIDHIKSVFSIDTDKIYATGVSNGAAAVWAQSEMYPDRFAGIFPVSGPVNSSLICNLKDLPVINVSSKTEELYAWAYKSVHEKLRSFPKYTGVLSEKMCHDDLTWIKCKTDFIELMLKEARELYPKEIEYKTFSNRHRKAYWIEIHSISFGRKVAKIKAEMTQEGFDVRCSNVSGFTISLSPTANQKYISIKINNGKKFAVHNYINNEIHIIKTSHGYTVQGNKPSLCTSRKGTGLLDVYLKPLKIVVSDMENKNVLSVADAFSHPYTNGVDPVVYVDYPIVAIQDMKMKSNKYSFVIIDINNANKALQSLKARCPIAMDKSGFIYKNKRFNNEYVVMQVIPNPHDMDQSILYINSNQPRLFRQNLFTRKTILPSYANGLHPYWNNEALIFMNNKYYGIYEWGMNMEEIK